MAKWGMVIDISRCIACYGCFVACKDEYWNNDYPPYSAAQPKLGQHWIKVTNKERGKYPYIKVAYMPVPCMQCDDAPCMKAARGGAIHKRDDGIVIIDPEKAAGQKNLVNSCPYKAIYWNEEKKVAQKCTFCAHRLDQGKEPRCVQACPSEAIKFGDLDNPDSEVARLVKSGKVEFLHGEWNTKPNVHYEDLHKMNKNFIAGEVVFGDTDECAKGIAVILADDTGKISKTTTNAFGNFEFDGLNPGRYSLRFEGPRYQPKKLDVDLTTNRYVENIILTRNRSLN